MKVFDHLLICEHCDGVYRRLRLQAGEVAACPRCGAVLYRHSRLDLDRWLALTVAAAIVFVIANVCPVIQITLQGHYNAATLWQSALALGHSAAAPIAVPAALAMIVVPGLQISLLLWLLAFARVGRRAPGFVAMMRLLQALRPWSMVEVCMLGLLVSVVKLSASLDVAAGAGIWATAILTLLLVVVANRDVHWLWELTSPGPAAEGVRP